VDHPGESVAWGQWAITSNDPDFRGRGATDSGEDYGPAPGMIFQPTCLACSMQNLCCVCVLHTGASVGACSTSIKPVDVLLCKVLDIQGNVVIAEQVVPMVCAVASSHQVARPVLTVLNIITQCSHIANNFA